MAEFSEVETVAEAGYPGFDVTTWHGILVPAGTPPAIVSRLHGALVRIVALPEMQRQLAALGMEPETGTPAQFAADIAADVRHWAEVLRRTGPATR
jgi:tripartite-type tricarboxylate transporter receptor subunit TctC